MIPSRRVLSSGRVLTTGHGLDARVWARSWSRIRRNGVLAVLGRLVFILVRAVGDCVDGAVGGCAGVAITLLGAISRGSSRVVVRCEGAVGRAPGVGDVGAGSCARGGRRNGGVGVLGGGCRVGVLGGGGGCASCGGRVRGDGVD